MAGTPVALRPEFNNTGGVISALNVNVVPGVNPQVEQSRARAVVQSRRVRSARRLHPGQRLAHQFHAEQPRLPELST